MTTRSQRLDSVAEILMGQAPSGEAYNSEGEGWPLLAGAGDFRDGQPAAKKFTREAPRICLPGDIIMGVRASIGDKVIADREYCLGRGVAALRARPEVHDRYLWHWLSVTRQKLEGKGKGATFKQVTKEDIAELEIPLPPVEEQRRIAAILDKANLLRARSSEGAELLECLGVERLEQLVALYETGLASQKLEDLCDSGAPITYGILQPGPDLDDGIPYVRPSEIKDSRIEVAKLRKTSTEIARKYQKSELRAGDILLTIVGTIGELAIVPPELEGANITQSSCRIRIDSRSANPAYVYYYLKSKRVRRQIKRDRLGVAVERLNLHHVRDMEILLLPREIQERFAAEVMSLESVAFEWAALANRASALSGSLQHVFFGTK